MQAEKRREIRTRTKEERRWMDGSVTILLLTNSQRWSCRLKEKVETSVKADRNTKYRNVEEKADNDRSRNACIFEHRAVSCDNLAFSLRIATSSRHGYLRLSAPQGCGYPISRAKRGETGRK